MEIIRRVNWVDILSIILLIRIGYVSFQGGLGLELFSFLGVLLNLILSLHYYPKIGSAISGSVAGIPPELANFFGFFGLVVALALVIRLARLMLDKIIKIEWHSFIDSLGGAVVGIGKACLVINLTLIMLMLVPLPYMQWSVRDRSLTGKFFLKIGPALYARACRFIPGSNLKAGQPDLKAMMNSIMTDKGIAPVNSEKEKTFKEKALAA